jgi:hypothetical protein
MGKITISQKYVPWQILFVDALNLFRVDYKLNFSHQLCSFPVYSFIYLFIYLRMYYLSNCCS